MAKKKGDTEKFEDGLGLMMGAYDWQEAMKYAKFKFDDIENVLAAEEGENDGNSWQLLVKLKSGKYGWLRASCDYSGWGCQESGDSGICESPKQALDELQTAATWETVRLKIPNV